MRNIISLVLGGGRGTRLYPLTKIRSKPAVPLAGKYRLIDIPLSNCLNSGLNRIYVLTQFMSVSLHRHTRQTYRFDHFSGGYVELLAAQQTDDVGTDWYQGTADAVRKNLRYLKQADVKYVLILSGDQLYRMDYRDMVRTHEESKAEVTIAALPVHADAARSLGIMQVDESGRVNGFTEKPDTAEKLNAVRMKPDWFDKRGVASNGRECLASMGIYLFNRDLLVDMLTQSDHQDFGREVFPAAIHNQRHVYAHLFDGYWEDIGTIKAFYEANLALAGSDPSFSLTSVDAPIYSRPRFLPPISVEGATVTNSLVADGCRIGKNSVIENSVIGLRSIIGDGAVVKNSVVMGADFYEDLDKPASVPLGIGARSVIDGAILDKNCRIGHDVTVSSAGMQETSADAVPCVVRDGIAVIIKGGVLPNNWKSADYVGKTDPSP